MSVDVQVRRTRRAAAGGHGRRIAISARMAALDLVRNRVALLLLLLAPVVLFAVVWLTTGERDIPFELGAAGPGLLYGSERQLSLLFIAMAAISGVAAFLGFLLVLTPLAADRRLVFEGYRPGELLLARLLVMAAVALVVALWVGALLMLMAEPARKVGVPAGLLLGALVYGAIGMLIGAVVRRELEGMLVILLLVNIDAGWLQNPALYAHAHQRQLIRLLPAHHPSQLVMTSAFSDATAVASAILSLVGTVVLATAAAVVYALRTRVRRRPRGIPALVLLTAAAVGGCVALRGPEVPYGWTRETLSERTASCLGGTCTARLSTASGRLNVTTQARTYARHEIPGWGGTRARRSAGEAARTLLREVGAITEDTEIGIGSIVVEGAAADGWRLECASFWMDRVQIERDRDGRGSLTTVHRLTRGLHCDATSNATAARWRFTAGIAPRLQTVAVTLDSLSAAGAAGIDVAPPFRLQRVDGTDGPEATWHGTFGPSLVFRDGADPVAALHIGPVALLDLDPYASAELRPVLRLLAAAISRFTHAGFRVD